MANRSVPRAAEARFDELYSGLSAAIGENEPAKRLLGELADVATGTGIPDFDDIHTRMLDTVGHLQCADLVFYDLQNVPGELQPAAIVLHRATLDLDRLHNELDSWHAQHICRPKTDADDEAAAAECTAHMTPEERKRYREGMGLPAEAPTPPNEVANPLLGAVEAQRSRLINVLGAVQSIRIAEAHSDGAPEAQGALELVEDELQRILNALEGRQLRNAVGSGEEVQS
jgi:hypothetical protein